MQPCIHARPQAFPRVRAFLVAAEWHVFRYAYLDTKAPYYPLAHDTLFQVGCDSRDAAIFYGARPQSTQSFHVVGSLAQDRKETAPRAISCSPLVILDSNHTNTPDDAPRMPIGVRKAALQ